MHRMSRILDLVVMAVVLNFSPTAPIPRSQIDSECKAFQCGCCPAEIKCPINYQYNPDTKMCHPNRKLLTAFAKRNKMRMCCARHPVTGKCDPYMCPPGYKCAKQGGKYEGGCVVDLAELRRYAKKHDMMHCRTTNPINGRTVPYLCPPCYKCCGERGDCVLDCAQLSKPKCCTLMKQLMERERKLRCQSRTKESIESKMLRCYNSRYMNDPNSWKEHNMNFG